jgi:ABC-type nitrate/sulfonate/bicarbonate transport system ATPase subunit/ABC-type nitrate/sulfonate/bicarbonate transport system permease component
MSGQATVSGSTNPRRWIFLLAGICALLALWSAASLWGGAYFVPAPWTTLADTAALLIQAFTWVQILTTVFRILIGFAFGYVGGALCGMAMGSRAELDAFFKPLILFFQGMPPLLWAIPLVVVMGIGHLPAIAVISLITLPVVAVTVAEGMGSLPRTYREMLHLYAPGLWPRIRELTFPHLRPFLSAALNVGLVLAVKASVTAEYFGANDGIGFQVQSAYQSLQIRRLFSWGSVLILLIVLGNRLVPRIRLIGPALRSLPAGSAPITCSTDDIGGLKRIFTSKKSSPRIVVNALDFRYSKDSPILQNVSITVKARQIAVISGDSGVGKTTLLKLMGSLLTPTAGKVDSLAGIGFVFQDDRLLPWRSVTANTALPLLYQGFPRKDSLCFATYLLREAGLEGEGEKKPDELSGGMRKRAALARCFARIPEAILLDEPFSGLHREARRVLWDKLLHLLELHPVPVVIVTHFPEEVATTQDCRFYELRGKPATLSPLD